MPPQGGSNEPASTGSEKQRPAKQRPEAARSITDEPPLAARELTPSWGARLKRFLIGGKREIEPGVFHRVSLVAFLAWVGLGADGLSSSAYGPEEAFKALGEHTYLAIALAVATTFTVLVIAYSYSRIIEQFPFGGGGYVVASRLIGHGAGVVSGSALLIDYVLTISISVAAGADAIFSFLPQSASAALVLGLMPAKLLVEFVAISILIVLNLRGVKESVTILTPIFLTFLLTHAILIAGVVVARSYEIPVVVRQVEDGFAAGMATLGLGGMLALFMRAYSMGAGTYTGIEAVSNGLSIMREPKVQTGKRTMALMGSSLAITAGGLIVAYLLLHAAPEAGKTMNAVLVDKFAGRFTVAGVEIGTGFVLLTLVSEALLLLVAAQAGFIDGPRVMANMATDSYLPHRFSQLSDRLTMHYGVLLMGGASLLALLYTRGDVTHLVVMYSINVFVTFSLSQLGMCRFWMKARQKHVATRRKQFAVHGVALSLCVFILGMTVYEKFGHGGWVTLMLTGGLIIVCFLIRRHYRKVHANLKRLDEVLAALPSSGPGEARKLVPTSPTAVLLVGSYAGLGVHSLLTVQRLFPNYFENFVFISIGVIDSATFTNVEAVEEVREKTEDGLIRYVELATRLGLASDYRMAIGTEAVATAEELCKQVARDYPRSLFFAGKLVFQREKWFQRLLHNETAYQLQRRLQFAGLNAMVLPVRVIEPAPARRGEIASARG